MYERTYERPRLEMIVWNDSGHGPESQQVRGKPGRLPGRPLLIQGFPRGFSAYINLLEVEAPSTFTLTNEEERHISSRTLEFPRFSFSPTHRLIRLEQLSALPT